MDWEMIIIFLLLSIGAGFLAGGLIGAVSTYFATRKARETALETIKITEFTEALRAVRVTRGPAW